MTEKEIEDARREGERWGKQEQINASTQKRISRLENGFLSVMAGAAYMFLKSMGLVP